MYSIMQCFNTYARSSNGRIPAFEAENHGSNPCLASKIKTDNNT